jgi:hypothetical protein
MQLWEVPRKRRGPARPYALVERGPPATIAVQVTAKRGRVGKGGDGRSRQSGYSSRAMLLSQEKEATTLAEHDQLKQGKDQRQGSVEHVPRFAADR